jgi:hypothetical protein
VKFREVKWVDAPLDILCNMNSYLVFLYRDHPFGPCITSTAPRELQWSVYYSTKSIKEADGFLIKSPEGAIVSLMPFDRTVHCCVLVSQNTLQVNIHDFLLMIPMDDIDWQIEGF